MPEPKAKAPSVIVLLQALSLATMGLALLLEPIGLLLSALLTAQAGMFALRGCQKLNLISALAWLFSIAASLILHAHAAEYL